MRGLLKFEDEVKNDSIIFNYPDENGNYGGAVKLEIEIRGTHAGIKRTAEEAFERFAEEIREYIGRCRFLVASRFHAMIGALQRKVPVLLVGWSHKYKEVLDMFGLGSYAADYADLGKNEGKALLETEFERLEADEDEIRSLLDEHYDEVMESSYRNIFEISKVVDRVTTPALSKIPTRTRLGKIKKFPDIDRPEKYMGEFIECRRGYASDEDIRKNAASGGVVTALLVSLLKAGEIDGAFVVRTVIRNGELSYETMIATDEKTIKSCSSSIYMNMPLLKDLDKIRKFDGKVAVVLVPCLMRSLNAILKKDKELASKIVLKLGLFCSGNHTKEATLLSLKKAGVSLEDAERLYYRRGAWRGQSSVVYKDGSEKTFSYTKTLCAFKNAYFFEEKSCMLCQDHFATGADISFGDIWLKKMKKEPVKCTGYIIRTPEGKRMYDIAVKAGALKERHMSVNDCLAGQKRALSFKFACAKAKEAFFAKQGKTIRIDTSDKCKWNHKLAFYLAEKNRLYSEEKPDKLAKKPMSLIYYYMCFIRVLLSL